jgi:ComF family protein
MIRSGLSGTVGSLFDLFLPPSCSICGELLCKSNPPVCPICQEGFEPLQGNLCDCCGQPVPQPGKCQECMDREPHLEKICSACEFGGAAQDAVLRLKLDGRVELAPYLAGKISVADLGQDLLVPVPLHRKRLVQRGFNQSALIAVALSEQIGVPVDRYHLVRHRDTPSQFGMKDRQARIENVAGAFGVSGHHPFSNRRICLVDDVVTTGATLSACTTALHLAGAESVVAVTVARTVRW